MTPSISRREMLKTSAAAAALSLNGSRAFAAPKAEVLETKVISHQAEMYHGWPTVARRKCGQLVVVWSGGREAHICPFGRVEMMRSDDDGRTWGWPCALLDTEIDDRDCGVLETSKGTILVTTFTSLAYEEYELARAAKIKPGEPGAWSPERLARWQAAHNRLPPGQRREMLGEWMLRSTNGGATWSAPYRCQVNSPHGPFEMTDGRILYPGKELWHGEHRNGVCESRDDGQSWQWLATLPTRHGDVPDNYHELHGVEAADGRLVVQIRNHNKKNEGETLQTESSDGGKTWSAPHAIGVWGLPSHLMRLKDSRLLMTYGHRRPPYGNQARISDDGGRTWSGPVILSGDGMGGDLGYPSTVQLGDGSLLSVWYETMRGYRGAVLRQVRWKLG